MSPTLLDHLLGKLVLGLVSCNMVQSYLGRCMNISSMSTHPIGGTIVCSSTLLQDCLSEFKDMHSAAVESYLLICGAIEQVEIKYPGF